MTHTRQMADSEGEFAEWKDHPEPCSKKVLDDRVVWQRCSGECVREMMCLDLQDCRAENHTACGEKVRYREWDSSDGAYTDYQYRCAAGHTWWVDGIDS